MENVNNKFGQSMCVRVKFVVSFIRCWLICWKSVLLIHSTSIYEHIEWKQMHNIFEWDAVLYIFHQPQPTGKTKKKHEHSL